MPLSFAFLAALAAGVTAIAPSPSPPGGPKVGDVIATGAAPPGWELGSGGYWCRDYSPASTCFFTTIGRKDLTLVILAEPVTRTPRGGVLTERVTAVFVVPLGRGDYQSDCDGPPEHTPIMAVVSPTRHETRIYWTDGAQLFVLTRPYKGEPPCDDGD